VVGNANGTGETRLTNDTTHDAEPVWSPDGTRIAFQSKRDGPDFEIHVMNADGSDRQAITDNTSTDASPNWQPLPARGYPRPRGAEPMYISLVPAFEECTGAVNRVHGAPLDFSSCAPPTPASSTLTVGTPDANGPGAKSVGLAIIRARAGDPATPDDEASVTFEVRVSDVRTSADLTDHVGDLDARPTIRITDRSNTPHPGGPGPGTVVDLEFPFAVPCTATADATIGSTCAVQTSADAVLAGAVTEGRRAIWQLRGLELVDPVGDPFLTSGLFIP